MSEMHKITTIIQNSNSDASETLTNGLITNGTPLAPTKPFAPSSTTNSDRNNNNVMKKSMPPPIPPKKPLKNATDKTNTIDPVPDNKVFRATNNNNNNNTNANSSDGNKNSNTGTNNATSYTAAINHYHGPNASNTAGSTTSHKLSNPSKCADKHDGKGQYGVLNSLDNVGVVTTDCNGDPKTASDFTGTMASSDNHKKLNDDIVASTTIAMKCGSNSGISHHCDNGMY